MSEARPSGVAATDVRYAVGLPTVADFGDPVILLELACAAERSGWDGVFLWDHVLFQPPEAPVVNSTVLLAAIVARTSRVRLGIMISALPRRRVQIVARETATLDVLSGGRLLFGAGLGSREDEYAAFGEPADLPGRGRLLDENLDTLAALWTGAPVTLPTGYTVRMLPAPVQRPRVPVWCAGRWPVRAGLRRAARWDGAMPTFAGYGRDNPVPATEFAAATGYLREQRGGTLDGFDIALEGQTVPGAGFGVVAPYAAAGLTWWVEAMGWWRGGVAEARDRIAAGPPVN